MSCKCPNNFLIVLLILLKLLAIACQTYKQDENCCRKISGSCKTVCEQISLSAIAANPHLRENHLSSLRKFCSPQLTEFWMCMNDTLTEIQKGEDWSGRLCCGLPQSLRCQAACVRASRRQDVLGICRQSDELTFFSCLDRQQFGDECCANARSVDCDALCRNVFKTLATPSRETSSAVVDSCGDTSPKVVHCIRNFTRLAPAANFQKYLHCCEISGDSRCRETCKEVLRTTTSGHEMVDGLQEGGCGPPLPQKKFWQCFLGSGKPPETSLARPAASRIDRLGMDAAKLHCCNRATSKFCRRLCIKTYSDDWAKTWKDFDAECLAQPGEGRLLQCVEEVDEPCELGCDGLGYCANFNNRPTELFRSCSPEADEAARQDVALWQQQGFLTLPSGTRILVRNISTCSPNMWKAVACALQIKPCHRQTHANRICREDCFEMLSSCMDWSRMPTGQTAASICARLAAEKPSSPCISLRAFLEPSDRPYAGPGDDVRAPCKGEPCEDGEMCLVNRNCGNGNSCRPYKCVSGCKLGEVSQYMVPFGSYVRIPLPTENRGCQKICQCSFDGTIENCQPMPCVPTESCRLGNKKIDHGSTFFLDCNVCSCLSGEITCSKKQCGDKTAGRDSFFTSLPCNCPPHHVPVCGRNGNTYPSSCLAKCAGLRDADFDFGPCSSRDPCEPDPCGEGLRCLPFRKVCLSLLEKPCRQHVCVDLTMPCSEKPRDPVCDTEQTQHPNLCHLAKSGKNLAYPGPCLVGCRNDGLVCGIDGETHSSECAALAKRVSVDYRGPCLAVGLISAQPKPQCGPTIACSPLPASGCYAVTPPGACCPVCAGALRILYSRKQVDRALYALRGAPTNALTVSAVLESLERLVATADCSLRGFLTVELDIFVALVPGGDSPLRREVCLRETEKLAGLVRRSSSRVLTELGLSSLTAATIVHVSANGQTRIASRWYPLLVLVFAAYKL